MNNISFEVLLFLFVMYFLLYNIISSRIIEHKLNQLFILVLVMYIFNFPGVLNGNFNPLKPLLYIIIGK